MAEPWIEQARPEASSLISSMRGGFANFMQGQYASNFARGGIMAHAYGPTAQARRASVRQNNFGVLFGVGGNRIEEGSARHIRNLREMADKPGADKNKINGIIEKFEKQAPKKFSVMGMAGKALGPGFAAAYTGFAAATGGQGAGNKLQGGIKGAAGMLGGEFGMYAGLMIGATIGGLPAVALGMIGGGIAGTLLAEGVTGATFDKMNEWADKGKNQRKLEWVQNSTAFNTQKAYTMRQQSLSMMNRGQNTARSLMGKEAVMLHS